MKVVRAQTLTNKVLKVSYMSSLSAPSGALALLWPLPEGLGQGLPPTYEFVYVYVLLQLVVEVDRTYSSPSLPHLAHFPDLLTHGAHLKLKF